MAQPTDDAAIDLELQRQMLPVLSGSAWGIDALWLVVLVGVWAPERQPWFWLLLLYYVLVAGGRYLFHRLFAQRQRDDEEFRRWMRGYCVVSVLLGLGWAGPVVVARIGGPGLDLILPVVALAGMAINSAFARSPYPSAAVAFAAPALLVAGLALVPGADLTMAALAVGHAVYLAGLLNLVRTLHRGHRQRLVTDRDLHRTVAALERAKQEAEAANLAKSSFLAIMSHEIRTPMFGVVGAAELLSRGELDQRQRRLVHTVQSSAAALLRIIDDVLDFSKIEAGRMELERAPFSLAAVLDAAVETLRPQAAAKGLALTGAVAADTPDRLIGDETRVRQILLNLLGNAVKFTERGSVSAAARLEAGSLVLTVADSGIGIEPAELQRLFRPFTQADTSTTRRFGGSGLGLSIVRRLAQLMGGDVAVESTPGRGSTFTVTLTVEVAEPMPPAAVAQGLAGLDAACAGPRARVLVVDDYPINLEVLGQQFATLGVAVDMASGGGDALARWRAGRHALVLTDIHMPDLDGYALTRSLREEEGPGGPRTAIVALTADAVKGEAERCRAAGMDDYLSKPLTLERLQQTLERWLPGGNAQQQPASAAGAQP